MRIARWMHDGAVGEGIVVDGTVVPFPDGRTVADVLEGGLAAALGLRDALGDADGAPLADVRLLAPLQPVAIRDFSAYEEHVRGMTAGLPDPSAAIAAWREAPVFYFTNPHAVLGPDDEVTPPVTERLDFELEVAVVLGGPEGRDLDVEAADRQIFGYTIMNDWSARDVQAKEMRNALGPAKGKDFGTALGPWIVTADELAGHLDADGFLVLRAEAWVNGERIGDDLVSNMGWTFPELVAYASRAARVLPGDVLGAGTVGNGGCLGELWGNGSDLPALQQGDQVRLVVEGIGELVGTVGRAVAETSIPEARHRSPRHAEEAGGGAHGAGRSTPVA